ncbi:MAG TPA: glycosyltransferase family 39 protein [Polyangiaceae bacterium]|jgi:4-amino-4-deoxy-L-arabinose transferase-like glycosyltransferase|nr:glycosyltransferase family 39 protein [Polyangiaceae bacterium]
MTESNPAPEEPAAVPATGDVIAAEMPDIAAAPVEPAGVPDENVAPDPNAVGARRGLLVVAALLTLGSLFGPISASGIWEPYELNVADLSRRIAVTLLGGKNLIIDGATNYVPTAGELGRGELPFTSIAVGLRFLGLSEWAGRLPMALWGLLGVAATYLFVARLVDRVTAAFTVIVLATMPLFFLEARTILGDIVTMSSVAMAVAGLSIAVFDERPSAAARGGFAFLGVFGMLTGFGARGVFFGVALPALSVGVTWLVRRSSHTVDRLGGIFAVLALVLGVVGTALGLKVLFTLPDHQFSRLLGSTLDRHRAMQTHDAMVLELGHALFPWSAVVPFALGRLLRSPVGVEGVLLERESSARITVLVVSVLCFGGYTALAPLFGVLPFSGVFALAVAVAVMLRDFERGAPGSRTLALGVAALLVLFLGDFKNFPEKGLSAFVVDNAKFPESFKDLGFMILSAGTLVSAALFGLFFLEREEGQKVFDRAEHRTFYKELRHAYDGNIAFGLLALEASLAVLAAATVISDHFAHWQQLESMALPTRQVAKFGFLLLPVLIVSPSLVMLARDVCRVVLRRLRASRATAAIAAIGAFGAALSFGYYPLLARQMSPKEVFESYQHLAKPGETLAMMGAGSGSASARYYAHGDVRVFAGSQEAFNWLVERDDQRRWLVVRASEIAQMNAQFRAHRAPAKNLPVLDARSSEILLVSNRLEPGETNQNPFTRWVLEARPEPQRKLDVDFNGQLHAIGWAVTTPDGQLVPNVRAGKPYQFHFYYEVVRPISGEWQTFIHVDGYQRRYNGDHDTLEGKYPFHLWHQGDFIEDIHPFELEPNFTGGTYTVFFGLFRGEQRLEVKHGAAEDNRVNAGQLDVR